jgi:hypothetical protein
MKNYKSDGNTDNGKHRRKKRRISADEYDLERSKQKKIAELEENYINKVLHNCSMYEHFIKCFDFRHN